MVSVDVGREVKRSNHVFLAGEMKDIHHQKQRACSPVSSYCRQTTPPVLKVLQVEASTCRAGILMDTHCLSNINSFIFIKCQKDNVQMTQHGYTEKYR